jgi:hypothetical protein
MSSSLSRTLSLVSLIAGFISIGASIAIWFLSKSPDVAHGERFGIFVGLWAPTFMGLACWLQWRASMTSGAAR